MDKNLLYTLIKVGGARRGSSFRRVGGLQL
jgi:hypothetical protein